MPPAGGGLWFSVVGRLTNKDERLPSPNDLLICRPPEAGYGFPLLVA
jgi:hypothetical protein